MLIETAQASGVAAKRVTCEKCGCAYRYELNRSASAVSLRPLVMCVLFLPLLAGRVRFIFSTIRMFGATSRQGDQAIIGSHRQLRRALLRGVEPVACPNCGWYQRDMVAEARARFLTFLAWLGVALMLLTPVAAFVAVRWTAFGRAGDEYTLWLVTSGAGAGAGVVLLGLRLLLATGVNPNAGFPASRPPYPGSPPAVREAEGTATVAAQVQRLASAGRARAPRRPGQTPPSKTI